MTVWAAIAKTVICSVLSSTTSTASVPTSSSSQALHFSAEVVPILLDYELPGHPNTRGRGHAGIVGRTTLVWTHDAVVSIEAGVLWRIPFAHDFFEELGGLPILSMSVVPFGEGTLLRFGSLDDHHGYHPALVDEDRYRYGRNYEENYNRSIVAAAQRELGGDPFMPAEHGGQFKVLHEHGHAEIFVDWQLLETEEHREKFAFGVLGGLTSTYADVDFQFRLVHYGGELFTKGDPIRFAQLDPVRQPTSFAITGKLKAPSMFEWLAIEAPLAYLRGRLAQSPGAQPTSHAGFELGVDAILFSTVRLGYRLWLPREPGFGYLSEDGDPVYSGRRAHRARLWVVTVHGAAELSGRLDLVFAQGAEKVQYETVTALSFRWDPLLWSP